MPRCPMYYIARRRDPWRDAVVGLCQDYEAGLLTGWPDQYSNQAVAAVRYILSESKACGAWLMEG